MTMMKTIGSIARATTVILLATSSSITSNAFVAPISRTTSPALASRLAVTDADTEYENKNADQSSDLPTPASLQAHPVVDEKAEFEMEVGRALDILRSDYPKMLTESPSTYVLIPDTSTSTSTADILTCG